MLIIIFRTVVAWWKSYYYNILLRQRNVYSLLTKQTDRPTTEYSSASALILIVNAAEPRWRLDAIGNKSIRLAKQQTCRCLSQSNERSKSEYIRFKTTKESTINKDPNLYFAMLHLHLHVSLFERNTRSRHSIGFRKKSNQIPSWNWIAHIFVAYIIVFFLFSHFRLKWDFWRTNGLMGDGASTGKASSSLQRAIQSWTRKASKVKSKLFLCRFQSRLLLLLLLNQQDKTTKQVRATPILFQGLDFFS